MPDQQSNRPLMNCKSNAPPNALLSHLMKQQKTKNLLAFSLTIINFLYLVQHTVGYLGRTWHNMLYFCHNQSASDDEQEST